MVMEYKVSPAHIPRKMVESSILHSYIIHPSLKNLETMQGKGIGSNSWTLTMPQAPGQTNLLALFMEAE